MEGGAAAVYRLCTASTRERQHWIQVTFVMRKRVVACSVKGNDLTVVETNAHTSECSEPLSPRNPNLD